MFPDSTAGSSPLVFRSPRWLEERPEGYLKLDREKRESHPFTVGRATLVNSPNHETEIKEKLFLLLRKLLILKKPFKVKGLHVPTSFLFSVMHTNQLDQDWWKRRQLENY